MDNLIRTILAEWKGKNIPVPIPREVNLLPYLNMKVNKIIVLNGFRRVGKTYILYWLVNELLKSNSREEVVHINFEDERIPLKTEFLSNLLPTAEELFNKKIKYLFLDEPHNIPNWSKWVRRTYDNKDMKIFISGSSSKMSEEEIPTELRGRFLEIRVFPLSFKEFLNFKKISPDLKTLEFSSDEKPIILKELTEYITYGGLPEVVLEDENKKLELAQSYYSTVIKKDIAERYKVKNEESLRALLRLLLDSKEYSISKTYNTLKSLGFEVGKSTVQKYLSYIENSYFMFSLPIFSYKIKDQIQYPKKIYFIDNVFINSISTKFTNNFGRLYENITAIELKRRGKECYYWKNAEKEEVDFVIKEGTKIKHLMQICYDVSDPDTKKREIRSLLKASKELKCDSLIIMSRDYSGEEDAEWFGIKRRVKFMPLWKWLLKDESK
ncbi:AAA family ATPase [Candidatus Pacearchaeota archaeon RBG_13_36_9]|nr:MAG: AAA family ATPase [Candidatus Pacearchaeota archaeon RBG_13_36_9]HJX50900.1 ATP-binding protein [Candidatus Nanoarchaeia archaeon]